MRSDQRDQRLESYRAELYTQSEVWRGTDDHIAAYAIASQNMLHKNPNYQEVIGELLQAREFTSPTYAVNLVLRALQKQLLYRSQDEYPRSYTSPIPWIEAMDYVTDPSSEAHEEFLFDAHERELQSNISSRYKAVSLIANAMQARVSTQPNVLDVGCSRNHGLKRLALCRQLVHRNAGEKEVVIDEETNPVSSSLNKSDDRMRLRIFSNGLCLGRSVGLDIVPIDDEASRIWAKSCSFYPGELLDARRVYEYDFFDSGDSNPNVSFCQADFSKLDYESFRQNSPVNRFDIITFSTVLYQVEEEQRDAMISTAKDLLKPDGIIVVQDFVEIDEASPDKLKFSQSWFKQPYSYRTILLDPKNPKDPLTEVFRWDNGRCNKILAESSVEENIYVKMARLAMYSEHSAD